MTKNVNESDVANVKPSAIEATPEMIFAATKVLEAEADIDLGSGYTRDLAKRVLEAALRVRSI